MKKTGIALVLFAVGLLVLELVALRDPADDIWTITAVMRVLPCWAVGMVSAISGVIFGHIWWS